MSEAYYYHKRKGKMRRGGEDRRRDGGGLRKRAGWTKAWLIYLEIMWPQIFPPSSIATRSCEVMWCHVTGHVTFKSGFAEKHSENHVTFPTVQHSHRSCDFQVKFCGKTFQNHVTFPTVAQPQVMWLSTWVFLRRNIWKSRDFSHTLAQPLSHVTILGLGFWT